MIIVLDCSGRLCNRLVLFAHVLATAIDSGQAMLHLMAADALQFARCDDDLLKEYRVSCRSKIPGWAFALRCRQAFYERVRPPNVRKYKAGNAARSKRMARHGLLPHVVFSWWYRDPCSLLRQRDKICRILAPRDVYTLRPKAFEEKLRIESNRLIGVHMRRGDYKEYANGKYFFSDLEYARFMEMARNVLPDGTRFVMVSDEPIDEKFFRGRRLDVSVFRGDDFREDLVMLSLCDYVMGPWSTFSWWAAFSGGGKLCHLRNRDDVIDATSFREITGEEV